MLTRLDWTVSIWRRTDTSIAGFKRKPSEQIIEQMAFTPYVFEEVGQFYRPVASRSLSLLE